jgi:hypothetical protein
VKSITNAALAALADGTAIVVGAVEVASDPPVRVWGGNGPIELGGNLFDPIGDRSLVQVAGGALGSSAQGITLSLSGIEEYVLELLDAEEVEQASAALWRTIWAGDGCTLLDAHIWARGRLDEMLREDDVGGTSTLSASLETAARGLGRAGGRMRTDADQRLIKPNDGFFRKVAFAGELTLYWGGRKPTNAGTALGGSVGGGSGGGRSFREFLK